MFKSLIASVKKQPDMWLLPMVIGGFSIIALGGSILENIFGPPLNAYQLAVIEAWERNHLRFAHVDLSDPSVGLELEINRGEMQDAYDRARESDDDRAGREYGDMS